MVCMLKIDIFTLKYDPLLRGKPFVHVLSIKFISGVAPIDLPPIPLQCVRTIPPERGLGGQFHTFAVIFPPRPRFGAVVL